MRAGAAAFCRPQGSITVHHVIQWSGGIGSWATAELVRQDHPDEPITLLFADVKIEDSDLYRFNADASARLGIPITPVCDGRTPFELFTQRSYLGNSRIASCSLTCTTVSTETGPSIWSRSRDLGGAAEGVENQVAAQLTGVRRSG